MRLEDKAKRVREIIDKLEVSDIAEKVLPLLTNEDLYVIHEVLCSTEKIWVRQAHFRDVSKLRRAEVRIKRKDTKSEAWRKAKAIVDAASEEHKRITEEIRQRQITRENMLAADRDYLRSVGSIPPGSPRGRMRDFLLSD